MRINSIMCYDIAIFPSVCTFHIYALRFLECTVRVFSVHVVPFFDLVYCKLASFWQHFYETFKISPLDGKICAMSIRTVSNWTPDFYVYNMLKKFPLDNRWIRIRWHCIQWHEIFDISVFRRMNMFFPIFVYVCVCAVQFCVLEHVEANSLSGPLLVIHSWSYKFHKRRRFHWL